MTRSTNMEHVEVLWAMLRKCVYERLARKSADREADALAAAIAALSAPQPPAEAQPVGSVRRDTGVTITLDRLPYYRGDRLTSGTKLYAHPPPSAPVGVERCDPPVECQRDMLAQGIREAALKAGIVRADAPLDGPTLLMLCEDLAELALAQQPAACTRCGGDGEVASTDPYAETEPCPECKPNRQPAAVDESFVERFCGRWFQLTGRSLDRPSVRACLTEALAAQPGGSDNDR